MFELWYSNRLEELVDVLALMMVDGREAWYAHRFERPADLLAEIAEIDSLAARRDPFETEHLVVPNWNIKRHLQLELARRIGVVANLEFHRIRRFLAESLPDEEAGEGGGRRILDRDLLEYGLFDLLGEESLLEEPTLAPVREYLRVDELREGSEARIRRRHQLAARLSKLFVDYAFNRAEMLEGWREGPVLPDAEPAVAERYHEVERWQRRLWLELTGGGGYFERVGDAEEQYRTLPQAVAEVDEGALEAPGRVHVFGVSYVASVYGRILHRLSEETEVYFYCLNPCAEYWEDLRTGRRDEEIPRWEAVASALSNRASARVSICSTEALSGAPPPFSMTCKKMTSPWASSMRGSRLLQVLRASDSLASGTITRSSSPSDADSCVIPTSPRVLRCFRTARVPSR